MNKSCQNCGKEAEEGEMFYTFLDPKGEWWLHLFDNMYCNKCVENLRNNKENNNGE